MSTPPPVLALPGGAHLRPWSPDDAPALHAAFAEPEVLRWSWPHDRPYLRADAEAYLRDRRDDDRDGPERLATRAVARRAGFTEEGLLRSHLPFRGGRRDTLVHSLLRDEARGQDSR